MEVTKKTIELARHMDPQTYAVFPERVQKLIQGLCDSHERLQQLYAQKNETIAVLNKVNRALDEKLIAALDAAKREKREFDDALAAKAEELRAVVAARDRFAERAERLQSHRDMAWSTVSAIAATLKKTGEMIALSQQDASHLAEAAGRIRMAEERIKPIVIPVAQSAEIPLGGFDIAQQYAAENPAESP